MATTSKCPICGSPTVGKWRPFCSRRCREVDLNRWLSGAYVIPAAPDDEDDERPSPPLDGGEETSRH